MLLLFRVLSWLPLRLLHGLGALLGWLAYGVSASYRANLNANAALAGISSGQRHASVAQAGCMVAELPRLWFGPPVPVHWDGLAAIEAAHAAGRGLLFLTPHLGCFEITAQAYAARFGQAHGPITVLYRPARKAWLAPLIEHARQRSGLATAPTTLAGVRQLLRALRAGRAVGLLPDQVPPAGQGVWAPFFGREAYTMTLAARLACQTGCTVLLAWGERLPAGRGYRVHLRPLLADLAQPEPAATGQINAAMESLIRERPQQYLWGYARWKLPAEAPAEAAFGPGKR